jgi:VCBS repeat-containing protein
MGKKSKDASCGKGRSEHEHPSFGGLHLSKHAILVGTHDDNLLLGNEQSNFIIGLKGDDTLFGNGGNDRLKGGKGNDKLYGGEGNDRLDGGKGNDVLEGGAGNDRLDGGKGNDVLEGGAGDDRLDGGKGNDVLEGGAGNDRLDGGKGDDVAVYSMAANLGPGFADIGAHDVYDGGRGHDTLVLRLSYGEHALASVQADIANFLAFLSADAKACGGHGRTFEFQSFDLDVRGFEALVIELVNTAPVAADDAGEMDEDTPLVVPAAAGVLSNDSDPDHLDVLSIVDFDATSALGAAVQVNADGSYSYDPRAAPVLQALAAGETTIDQFTYLVSDLAGETSSATVLLTVTGVNDAPVGVADAYALNEDETLSVSAAGVLTNDTDVDGPTLSAIFVAGPAHGMLTLNLDGSFSYVPDADYFGSDSFSYRASDGLDESGITEVTLAVREVNDDPIAATDSATVAEDSVDNTIVVLSNDVPGPANESGQTLTVVSAVAMHGTVDINPDGTLSYAPDADYFGEDTIQYTILDDGTTNGSPNPLAASGKVDVTVTAINDSPVAVDDAYATDEDSVRNGNVLLNDSDVDGDQLVVTSTGTFGTALGATVTLFSNGVFSYDPRGSSPLQALSSGSSAVDSFDYVVSDGKTGNDVGTVEITVTGLDEPTGGSGGTGGTGGSGGSGGSGKIAASVSPGTPLDYYIRFEGDGLTNEWLRLEGFDFGLQNSGAFDSKTGGGAGKVSASDFGVTLGSSEVIPVLGELLASGKSFKGIEVEVYAPGGGLKGGAPIGEYKFEDVLVTSLDANGGGSTVNNLGFAFGSYAQVQADAGGKSGTAGNTFETGWDFVSGKGGPSISLHADADPGKLGDALSTDVALDYYVRFEGLGDWLRLEDFSFGLSQSGSFHVGGGGGAGKASASDVQLTLGSSSLIARLADMLTSGKIVDGVEIEAYAPGFKGGPTLVDEYVFDQVLLTSLNSAEDAYNSVGLTYARYSHGHESLGKLETTGGWDFTTNTPWDGPAPDADVFF